MIDRNEQLEILLQIVVTMRYWQSRRDTDPTDERKIARAKAAEQSVDMVILRLSAPELFVKGENDD